MHDPRPDALLSDRHVPQAMSFRDVPPPAHADGHHRFPESADAEQHVLADGCIRIIARPQTGTAPEFLAGEWIVAF